jgi:hypothetical protein
VSRQGVVEVPDEVVAVLRVQRHESAAHDNELDLRPSRQRMPSTIIAQVRD